MFIKIGIISNPTEVTSVVMVSWVARLTSLL